MKQNQTFFHGINSNLTSFFNRCENFLTIFIVSIFQFHCKSKQKQVKSKQIILGICKPDKNFPHLQSFTVFRNLFLEKFVSKMNNDSFKGKMAIIIFYSINVKGNWAYLTGKNLWAGAKISGIFRLSQK